MKKFLIYVLLLIFTNFTNGFFKDVKFENSKTCKKLKVYFDIGYSKIDKVTETLNIANDFRKESIKAHKEARNYYSSGDYYLTKATLHFANELSLLADKQSKLANKIRANAFNYITKSTSVALNNYCFKQNTIECVNIIRATNKAFKIDNMDLVLKSYKFIELFCHNQQKIYSI